MNGNEGGKGSKGSRAKGVKRGKGCKRGQRKQRGKGHFRLGFWVPTTCDHKRFDYNI